MATKKTGTTGKKTSTAKKPAAKKKTTTTRSSSARSTTKRSTTSARKPAASRTKQSTANKSTAAKRNTAAASTVSLSEQFVARYWNNYTQGILLLLLAFVLELSLCRLDGILLGGVLKVIGGLLGCATQMFCLALCLAGMFLLCSVKGARLRVMAVLSFPLFWGALTQCFQTARMSVSLTTIVYLWQVGVSPDTGGVLGGMLSIILSLLLSDIGAKILLILIMLVNVFLMLNTTPLRLYRSMRTIVKEDTEQLRGDDMTVTPAKPMNGTAVGAGLFAAMRNRRGRRKAEKLRRAQQTAQQAAQPIDLSGEQLSSAVPQPNADAQARYERKLAARRRLAQAMPEIDVDIDDEIDDDSYAAPAEQPPVPAAEVALPWENDEVPPWEDASVDEPVLEQPSAAKTKKQKKSAKQDEQIQVHEEITHAMDIPLADYTYPSMELLKTAPRVSNANLRGEQNDSAARLVDTLASFGIEVTIINIVSGPSVTRFEMQIERGVKFSRITALSDDIALALGAYSVRIAPIPDKIAIGIEVPNKTVQMVMLRDVLSSRGFVQSSARLSVALGKDITGTAQVIDLAKMPHLLIAGTTGSGKSVCINSILISLLYKSSPEDVRLIMIDPKMVELGNYNGIPHLLVPVVTDPKKASGALSWAVSEMERRYAMFAAAGVRDMGDFNQFVRAQQVQQTDTEEENAPKQRKLEPLPHIVIVIDELADLMMVAAKEVETSICRIAQKARAAGMHLVVATQRPSADVITGIMKSNIPSRIAFAVASQVESRIILDTTGAEKLIGKGDMLYSPIGINKPARIQGCFVSSEEIERVIAAVKTNAEAEYSQEVMDHIERQAEAETSSGGYNAAEDEDELLPQAITVVVESGQASVSMLQRRLKLGYARAARLVDQMEQRGIVGAFEGSKPRQVLISKDDWMQIQLRQKI